jgi:hypothetical protein
MRATRTCAGFAAAAVVAGFLGAHVRAGLEARRELDEGTARLGELEVAVQIRRACSEQQLRLAREVAAGRMPLAEAADDVLEVNRARPWWLTGLANTFPTDPDDRVRVARVLVAWVKVLTADDPRRSREAVGRVTAEFEQLTDAADD